MHMADALISPTVGGAMWAAAIGLAGYGSVKVRKELDDRKVPLMGVAGAFVFAAQMLNFAIPATGASGHLGGGLILAVLLGPHAAFLVMASVLFVQALFFADGGLLALGCNIVNLGFFPCFVAYPLLFRRIAGRAPNRTRLIVASLLAAVVGLQLGAFGVVLETRASGVSDLPFGAFALLMLPIHLAIGVVEGLATAAVVLFVWRTRPDVLDGAVPKAPAGILPLRNVLIGLSLATLVAGGVLSGFASTRPDGLEWSMARASGKAAETAAAADAGSGLSGLVGSALVLLVAALLGFGLRHRRAAARQEGP